MLNVGCHLSSSKGFAAMGRTARSIGANTFQFFTRNPRGSRARPFDPDDAQALNALRREYGFSPIVAHAPYTINPCSAEEQTREFARQTMADDLQRLEHLDDCYYNFHPGSHVGQGAAAGIAEITAALNAMSGKGSEVGGSFEELRAILDGAAVPERLGVCLDTCHVSDAGYDILGDLDGVLERFDRVIGLQRLRALHLNDSRNPPGSRKDRHAKLDEGYLGMGTFRKIIRHPALRDLPMILETPNELDGYAREIAMLRAEFE